MGDFSPSSRSRYNASTYINLLRWWARRPYQLSVHIRTAGPDTCCRHGVRSKQEWAGGSRKLTRRRLRETRETRGGRALRGTFRALGHSLTELHGHFSGTPLSCMPFSPSGFGTRTSRPCLLGDDKSHVLVIGWIASYPHLYPFRVSCLFGMRL